MSLFRSCNGSVTGNKQKQSIYIYNKNINVAVSVL